MIEKKYRVTDHRDFQAMFHLKKFRSNEMFILYYQEKQLPHSRVGIAVSKKLGNAVTRNKIKRQVRSMVRTATDFNENFDAIVVVAKKYDLENYEACQKRFNSLWQDVRRKRNEEI